MEGSEIRNEMDERSRDISISPLWARTISMSRVSPKELDPRLAFVAESGSYNLLGLSASLVTLDTQMLMVTNFGPFFACTSSRLSSGMARLAFAARFIITCWIWLASAITVGRWEWR